MLRKVAHWLVVGALVLTIGGHWALLQSVAWVGMAVKYSQKSTFKEGLAKTFDGQHPCKLCKAVEEGKKSERKQQAPNLLNKLELFCFAQALFAKPPVFPPLSPDSLVPHCSVGEAPPKPPPRQVLS